MSASATQGGHNKEYGDDTTMCIVHCVSFVVCSAYREKIGSAERHSLELVGRVHVCDSYLIFDTVERRDVYYRRPRPHQHRDNSHRHLLFGHAHSSNRHSTCSLQCGAPF